MWHNFALVASVVVLVFALWQALNHTWVLLNKYSGMRPVWDFLATIAWVACVLLAFSYVWSL